MSYFRLECSTKLSFPIACAYATGNQRDKEDAFNLAKSSLQTLIESDTLEPCISCYTNFFLVIARLLKPGRVRDLLAEAAFNEASAKGKVDKQVKENFRKASPKVASMMLSEKQESHGKIHQRPLHA